MKDQEPLGEIVENNSGTLRARISSLQQKLKDHYENITPEEFLEEIRKVSPDLLDSTDK